MRNHRTDARTARAVSWGRRAAVARGTADLWRGDVRDGRGGDTGGRRRGQGESLVSIVIARSISDEAIQGGYPRRSGLLRFARDDDLVEVIAAHRSFGITALANSSMLRLANSSGITPNCGMTIRFSNPVWSRTRSIFSRTVRGLPITAVPLPINSSTV